MSQSLGSSPDFSASPAHKSVKQSSPLSPDTPVVDTSAGGGVTVGGLSVGVDSLGLEVSPRNDMAMRRRSVDMAYLMSSGKLSDNHSHEHEHEHEHANTHGIMHSIVHGFAHNDVQDESPFANEDDAGDEGPVRKLSRTVFPSL